jgi:hypothetical protein
VAIAAVTDESAELLGRIAIVRSVLGHAPTYRSTIKALAALDGASLEELAAMDCGPQEAPAGSREYLHGWHDGYDAGHAAALEQAAHAAPSHDPR